MRNFSLFTRSFIGAALLVPTLAFCAHAKPRKDVESSKATILVPSDVGDVYQKAANRKVVGERFRLWLSVNATDCNDPALVGNGGKDDKAFELYGELRVNDKVEWSVSRMTNGAALPVLTHLDLPSSTQVDPRTQGFSLNQKPNEFGSKKRGIAVSTNKKRSGGSTVHLSLQLFDKDDPLGGWDYDRRDLNKADRKDDKIGDYNIDLDLGKLGTSDGRYYWFWNSKDESGNPIGTNMYLYAEHVGTIYESTRSAPTQPTGPAASQPRGMRLKVESYFRVTNAIDGPGDNESELYGTVKFNGQTVWNVPRENAFGAGRDLYKQVKVGTQIFDVIFGNPSTQGIKVDGFLKDRDESGGDKPMWNPSKRTISLGIYGIYQRSLTQRAAGVYILQGDRDAESADLIFIVTKVGDIS